MKTSELGVLPQLVTEGTGAGCTESECLGPDLIVISLQEGHVCSAWEIIGTETTHSTNHETPAVSVMAILPCFD